VAGDIICSLARSLAHTPSSTSLSIYQFNVSSNDSHIGEGTIQRAAA